MQYIPQNKQKKTSREGQGEYTAASDTKPILAQDFSNQIILNYF
jgi:hypothetical protein